MKKVIIVLVLIAVYGISLSTVSAKVTATKASSAIIMQASDDLTVPSVEDDKKKDTKKEATKTAGCCTDKTKSADAKASTGCTDSQKKSCAASGKSCCSEKKTQEKK